MKELARQLERLDRRLGDLEKEMRASIARVAPAHRDSARNLVHYVALRQDDLRELQLQLSQRGLSSLGRSESCVRSSLLEVSARVYEALALLGDASAKKRLARLDRRANETTWDAAQQTLHRNTRAILGPRPDDRHIYVMVTAPSAKEADREWMSRMLQAGMNVLRINCAHEQAAEWLQVVNALDAARTETGRECRILMDLAGPKIRTGGITDALRLATWKPKRDAVGRAIEPARVVLRCHGDKPDATEPTLFVGSGALAKLRLGDVLRFRDARKKKRKLVVREIREDVIVAVAHDRAYVLDEAQASILRRGVRVGRLRLVAGTSAAAIEVREGDELVLTAGGEGRAARLGKDGRVDACGVVACTLPSALTHLDEGHRVFFDDGTIHGVVVRVIERGEKFLLRIVRTQREIAKLKPEKGINLPDTRTTVPSLTEEDHRALSFVAKHADAVGLSFVRTADDVHQLHRALGRLGRHDIGIVLKIETRAGFENLPRILLEGLRRTPLAIMIARGDLAVEVGFERLAELQEEILWLCEASHVPAIWATQVLDTLARTGIPSRAEVTDAAAGVAAECVMLNKGPFVDRAVVVLVDILRRMEKHHYKKRSLYRKLRVSTFTPAAE